MERQLEADIEACLARAQEEGALLMMEARRRHLSRQLLRTVNDQCQPNCTPQPAPAGRVPPVGRVGRSKALTPQPPPFAPPARAPEPSWEEEAAVLMAGWSRVVDEELERLHDVAEAKRARIRERERRKLQHMVQLDLEDLRRAVQPKAFRERQALLEYNQKLDEELRELDRRAAAGAEVSGEQRPGRRRSRPEMLENRPPATSDRG